MGNIGPYNIKGRKKAVGLRMHVQCSRASVQRRYRKKFRSRFAKKVSRVIASAKPLKKTVIQYALPPGVGGPIISLAPNSLDVISSSIFFRITAGGSSGYAAAVGGDTSATQTWTGDTVNGNVIYPKALHIRGVLRNAVYSPDVTVRLMLVRYAQGVAAPSMTNLWQNLTTCKLVDTFNHDNYTLIAQKDFHLRTCKHTGNYYLPQCKPGGGTVANDAVGTYWDTPGVSIVGNTNTTYDTENVVYFNANTMSGSYAPHTLPFHWHVPLFKKIRSVRYELGAPANGGGNGFVVQPNTGLKDFTYDVIAYTYANGIIGSTPTLVSCYMDECTIQCYWKDKD